MPGSLPHGAICRARSFRARAMWDLAKPIIWCWVIPASIIWCSIRMSRWSRTRSSRHCHSCGTTRNVAFLPRRLSIPTAANNISANDILHCSIFFCAGLRRAGSNPGFISAWTGMRCMTNRPIPSHGIRQSLAAASCFSEATSTRNCMGFDPRYLLYFEDFDISLRTAEIARIAYVPTVRIVHEGGRAADKGLWHIWQFVRSAGIFFTQHTMKVF